MMGKSHAVTGAAAWVLLTAPKVSIVGIPLSVGLFHTSFAQMFSGLVVCAGAAILPDLDHKSSHAARSLPPFSGMIARVIRSVSGGHRHGTHSFVGIAVFALLSSFFAALTLEVSLPFLNHGVTTTVQIGAGLMAMVLSGFALIALGIHQSKTVSWISAFLIAIFVAFNSPANNFWLPVAVALGVSVHILGDMLTTGGCNLVWPLRLKPGVQLARVPILRKVIQQNGYFAFPILGNAGSARETLVCNICIVYMAYVLCTTVFSSLVP